MTSTRTPALALVLVVAACGGEATPTSAPPPTVDAPSSMPTTTPTNATSPTAARPTTPAPGGPPPLDPTTGLVAAESFGLVAANCTACHSARLITQNRGDRARWEKTIRWMQATQGLWPLAPDVEDKILTYLSTYYAPAAAARRAALDPALMPPSLAEIARAKAELPLVERAKAALGPFKKAFMGALTRGLEGSAPHALDVCAKEAPALLAAAQSEKLALGRTSKKLRNPANAPRPWVTPLLDVYEGLPPDARTPRTVALDDGKLGYVEPIVIGALCLQCHGAALAPEVAAALTARYPQDAARGYREGELRGLFWVEVTP